MMLEELRAQVCAANLELPRRNLVTFTWGNVSGIDRAQGLVVFKPSGVAYEDLTPDRLVVVELATGRTVEGTLRPSSDTKTHLELYRAFPGVNAVVHTHSRYATALAQAERGLPCYGTTHADTFYGEVPCTRHLTAGEVEGDYERNTGLVIAETFRDRDPEAVPAVLVCKHGPFTWGTSCRKAVENALILEETAHMAFMTELMSRPAGGAVSAPQYLLDKHYFRKHGANAYYGQH